MRHSGKLSESGQQSLILDVVDRSWDDTSDKNVTLWSRLAVRIGSVYNYVLPGFLRHILFIPTYILTYPVRLFIEKDRMDILRDRTRRMAIKGLWSFIVPAVFLQFA